VVSSRHYLLLSTPLLCRFWSSLSFLLSSSKSSFVVILVIVGVLAVPLSSSRPRLVVEVVLILFPHLVLIFVLVFVLILSS